MNRRNNIGKTPPRASQVISVHEGTPAKNVPNGHAAEKL